MKRSKGTPPFRVSKQFREALAITLRDKDIFAATAVCFAYSVSKTYLYGV